MKRLSVRLSIVGTVLALGAAAIAHSVLSEPPEEAPQQGEGEVLTAKSPADPPSPIRVERNMDADAAHSPAEDTLKPPPAELFQSDRVLRTVSHESAADSDDSHISASAIPTDDTSPGGGGFPLGPPKFDSEAEFPAAVAESSPSEFNSSSIPVPPAPPAYGRSLDTSPPLGAAENSVDELTSESADIPEAVAIDSGGASDPPQPGSTPSATDPTTAEPIVSDSSTPSTSYAETAAVPLAPTLGEVNPAMGESRSLTTDNSDTYDSASAASDNTLSPSAASGATGVLAAGAVAGAAAVAGSYPSTGETEIPTAPASSGMATTSGAALSDAPPTSGSYAASQAVPPGVPAYPSTANTTAMPAPRFAATGALMASNVPGDLQLEGQQAPSITVEKLAPQEVQVNRQATFELRVRNQGTATAHHVTVVDRVPQGTQFVSSNPPVSPSADGSLIWQLDTVKAGEEVIVTVNLLPQIAGEIGSVAQVTFQALASVRTVCTRPELALEVSASSQVLIGQPVSLEIVVTNTGNGIAEGVILEEDVPAGFVHAAGRELEHEIGMLRPQESRRLTLALDSAQPGDFQNRLTVRGEGDLFAEDIRPISVTSPQLQVGMEGPTLRYLDRKATYSVSLANPGTAPARNVELVTYLPKGMKYVTSDKNGQYDSQSHAVYWNLEELPAKQQGDVMVTVLPIEPGNQKLKTDVRADLGLNEMCEHEVAVEGLAELTFVISDIADPIEVGADTTYEVKILNRGSKADSDVVVVAEFPPGLTATSGDGPTQATVQGQHVVFEPLSSLGPGEEAVFRIHVHGATTGDHVIRAQVRSAELRVPVTKEEITRVYTDN